MLHDGVLGIHGQQANNNLSGQHYMHNRIYDINTARFTTPDPAASPYWNLQDYVGGNPISRSDPSGLKSCTLKIYTLQHPFVEKTTTKDGDAETLPFHKKACKSNGSEAFKNCILDFLETSGCKCVTELTIVGHGVSGLGHGEIYTSYDVDERKDLRLAMCSKASIELMKCSGCSVGNEEDIMTILLGGDTGDSQRGEGYDGLIDAEGKPVGETKRVRWIVPKDAGTHGKEVSRVRHLRGCSVKKVKITWAGCRFLVHDKHYLRFRPNGRRVGDY